MGVNDGSILLKFISKLDELEWKKFQHRYPYILISNKLEIIDHSSYPPFTSFRFKNKNTKIIEMLTQAISSYQGDVDWVLISKKREYCKGINYCILTKYVQDKKEKMKKINKTTYSVDQYIAENMPQFGPIAYNDLHYNFENNYKNKKLIL
ncbi:hypothetical protein [Proteus sp. NMG38-2]|uniref:hypothetical protein n=1 Tax=Proteus sp. NMG38-2 TaxID=2883107 RepID=UPI001D0A484B|nr:hypothetical protein [Proteus sp. NMG38-2]UDN36887.1 hypothetical protein LG402_04250 [Proteus sp. NMG38-2]